MAVTLKGKNYLPERLKGMDTLAEGNRVKTVLPPLVNSFYSRRKEFAELGANSFYKGVDSFPDSALCTVNRKLQYSPADKMMDILLNVFIPFKLVSNEMESKKISKTGLFICICIFSPEK